MKTIDVVHDKTKYTFKIGRSDGWYIAKCIGHPNIFTQGKTMQELRENINDVLKLMIESTTEIKHNVSKAA